MKYDAKIWGPHYWFFLHTITYTYPELPNEATKRKYYDLIMNFPLFIPDETMGKQFALLIDKYPFVPYLDKRDSFIRWMNFIHNKINYQLKKKEYPLLESIDEYIQLINSTKMPNKDIERIYYLDLLVYFILICFICFIIYYFYTYTKV